MRNIEEEGVKATIVLAKLHLSDCKTRKEEAERKWQEADAALILAEQKLEQLKEELESKQWARAFEAGKTPNREIQE